MRHRKTRLSKRRYVTQKEGKQSCVWWKSLLVELQKKYEGIITVYCVLYMMVATCMGCWINEWMFYLYLCKLINEWQEEKSYYDGMSWRQRFCLVEKVSTLERFDAFTCINLKELKLWRVKLHQTLDTAYFSFPPLGGATEHFTPKQPHVLHTEKWTQCSWFGHAQWWSTSWRVHSVDFVA